MTRLFHKWYIRYRADRIKTKASRAYDSIVWNCAGVSGCNKYIAFVIHRDIIFGWPRIELIDRPSVVNIPENLNVVVTKDGHIYELNKTR